MTDPWVKPSADLVEPLVAEVARLGGMAEAQIADCIDAISRRDVPLAQAVIARDAKLDALQADVERRAIEADRHSSLSGARSAARSRRSRSP